MCFSEELSNAVSLVSSGPIPGSSFRPSAFLPLQTASAAPPSSSMKPPSTMLSTAPAGRGSRSSCLTMSPPVRHSSAGSRRAKKRRSRVGRSTTCTSARLAPSCAVGTDTAPPALFASVMKVSKATIALFSVMTFPVILKIILSLQESPRQTGRLFKGE
uniref:Reelin n=1 Tax=Sus scrofa TaxID=9823 RepID=A0A8D1AB48_PIG